MRLLSDLRIPPVGIRGLLARDALVLWLGVRLTYVGLFATLGRAVPPLVPTPRMSVAIVTAAWFMCFVQVQRFRESVLFRNLGVSLPAQLLYSASLVVGLELAARLIPAMFGATGGVP
jgi:hypothetical protein